MSRPAVGQARRWVSRPASRACRHEGRETTDKHVGRQARRHDGQVGRQADGQAGG